LGVQADERTGEALAELGSCFILGWAGAADCVEAIGGNMKIVRLFLLMSLLAVSVFNTAAQDLESCTILRSDLPSETQTHIRNRDERVGNLTEILEEISKGNVDEDLIYELMYWPTMADSAAERFIAEYPECLEYDTLDTVFRNMIEDVYALSVHASLLFQGRLTDPQRDNVLNLVSTRSDEIVAGIGIWNTLYNKIDE
jgi:hypothetical protein